MTNKLHAYAMHAKISEENIHATRYLQEKPDVVVDPDVLLHFITLPFPYFPKTSSRPHSPRIPQETLNVQEYEKELQK